MNKREIYIRWAVSLCALGFIICYQLTRPAEEQTDYFLPAASAAAPSEPNAAAEAPSEESASSADSAEVSEVAEPEATSEAVCEEAGSDSVAEAGSDSDTAASAEPESEAQAEQKTTETPQPASAETAAPKTESAASAEPSTPRGPYTDGVYSGSGNGFGGKIYVSVTVQNGYIAAVDVTSAEGDDKPYLRDALQITGMVIAAQSTQLDAISGATSTTWGILDAIDDALKGA